MAQASVSCQEIFSGAFETSLRNMIWSKNRQWSLGKRGVRRRLWAKAKAMKAMKPMKKSCGQALIPLLTKRVHSTKRTFVWNNEWVVELECTLVFTKVIAVD